MCVCVCVATIKEAMDFERTRGCLHGSGWKNEREGKMVYLISKIETLNNKNR